MTARGAIFGAIRKALGPQAATPEAIATEAAALVADRAAVQPGFGGVGLIERFIAKATSERVTATVARVADFTGIPDEVRAYIDDNSLSTPVAVQPDELLNGLDWGGIAPVGNLAADGGLAVTRAEYGIAETGSLAFRSAPEAPILLNFLPLHHLVVLKADRILAYSEDLWPHLGGPGAPQPRLLTLITGTSGTADIEARNIRGAHGPKNLRIILVGGS